MSEDDDIPKHLLEQYKLYQQTMKDQEEEKLKESLELANQPQVEQEVVPKPGKKFSQS